MRICKSFLRLMILILLVVGYSAPTMAFMDNKFVNEDLLKLLGHDKNRRIVVYCGFVKCTRSHNGAAWAVKLGYKNVYRYPGGIFAWKGADYTVEKVDE